MVYKKSKAVLAAKIDVKVVKSQKWKKIKREENFFEKQYRYNQPVSLCLRNANFESAENSFLFSAVKVGF